MKTAGEIAASIEIVSALHQRFGPSEFTKQLGWLVGRGLSSPDKAQIKFWTPEVREREEKERLARHRILLKIVTELWLVDVLRSLDDVERPDDLAGKADKATANASSKTPIANAARILNGLKQDIDHEAEPFPLEVLKDLLGHDRDHSNLPLAVLFVKSFGWDILGVRSQNIEGRKVVDVDGATSTETRDILEDSDSDESHSEGMVDNTPLVSEVMRQRFRNIFFRYLDDVKAHVVRDQRSLNNQRGRNAEAYVRSGEIFEDRKADFEKQTKAQERLIGNTQILCDALAVDMPDLTEKDSIENSIAGSIGLVRTGDYLRGQGEGAGIWEDEDERRFYENIVDLKGRVPAILLDDGKKKAAGNEEDGSKKLGEAAKIDTDDKSTAIANKTVGAQVDALLIRLPDLQTKDAVDQIALDFCFLNSKASRNRLIKSLQEIPKGRTDLLPLYSRLIATLGQYMPDILQAIITHLDDEFRSLQRRKSKEFLGQVRMLNIRYLAELTKFGAVAEHVIFHCFKISLDDFSRMNIEIMSNLLENCGRYLFRNPETSPRMSSFLETLGRKKSAQHLGPQERMLIENALYYVNPPQRAAIQQKERTPMDLYIRQLIYLEMNKRSYPKVLKSIRKLHWEEDEVVAILGKIFSKPGKVKFSNIHLLAVLLGALYRYHSDFVVSIIDNILENITLGLEQNDFKFNQRRVSEVKYLGELYNYKMVDSIVIFDTLYRIITFGHENGTPSPNKISSFDLPDDFFRIRLVCTILDTCGICFDRGTAKKKLDFFLTFLQYYALTKDPLPLEIDFLLQDTYAYVRPQWRLVTDFDEAGKLFSEAIASNYRLEAQEKAAEPEDDGEDSLSEDGMDGEAFVEGDEAKLTDEEIEVRDLVTRKGMI